MKGLLVERGAWSLVVGPPPAWVLDAGVAFPSCVGRDSRRLILYLAQACVPEAYPAQVPETRSRYKITVARIEHATLPGHCPS